MIGFKNLLLQVELKQMETDLEFADRKNVMIMKWDIFLHIDIHLRTVECLIFARALLCEFHEAP